MAYEKKIEPLEKYEVIMAGVSLLLWIICMHILPLSTGVTACTDEFFKVDIQSMEDLTEFHKCIKSERSSFLAGSTFLLLGYPIIIAHLYYFNRILDTILSFLNVGVMRWLYIGSWGIVATILCTVFPALLIFVSYYDWEFDATETNSTYVGYAMQFQIAHFAIIISDSVEIPMGICAAIPWMMSICIILGLFKSAYYDLSEESRTHLVASVLRCPRAGKVAILVIDVFVICVCLFGSFGDVFDYAREGFFSFNGKSQFLYTILLVAWAVIGIIIAMFGCKIEKHQLFLNENVKPLSAQGGAVN